MTFDLGAIDAGLGSADEDTRWQAAIALGEHCEDAPEAIWPLIVKWGSSEDEDVQAAIATCVLEHVLEHHFNDYFPKTVAIVYGGNKQFAGTFRMCWKFGNAEATHNNQRWDNLETFVVAINAAKAHIATRKASYERKRQMRQSGTHTGGKSQTRQVRKQKKGTGSTIRI